MSTKNDALFLKNLITLFGKGDSHHHSDAQHPVYFGEEKGHALLG